MSLFKTGNRTFFATQLLSFVGINVVVLGLVAFVTLNSMTSTVNGIVEHSIKSLIEQTTSRIEAEVHRIGNDMRSVASLQAIHEYLDAPLFAKKAWEDQVLSEFRNFLGAHDEIALIRFVPTDGEALAVGQNDYIMKASLTISDAMKVKIADPKMQFIILDPNSVLMTDEFGTVISQKFVFFVARVLDKPKQDGSGAGVSGFLVSAVTARHFQRTLEALNLAGVDAPSSHQTNSFLLNPWHDPITQNGPEATKLADPDRRIFATGIKDELARLTTARDIMTFSSEVNNFPTAYTYWYEEPETHWKVLALVPEAYVLRDVRHVRNILFSILTIGLVVATLLTYYASRRITRPIGDLVEATEYVSAGNLDRPIHLDSFEEFNTLGQNFNAMTLKLKATIAERIAESERKASLEQELKTASLFQKLFLPSGRYQLDGLDLVAHYQPASHMGGDWFSYGLTGDDWLHVHLGDVTGHGTASALVASFCKGVTDALYQDRLDTPSSLRAVPLEAVHQVLNNLLFAGGQSMSFMTMLSLALNLETGELRYMSSGHPPQFVVDEKGVTLLKQASGGTLLGFKTQDKVKLSGTMQLKAGQSIFLYSDGLIDVAAQGGQKFNQRRLAEFLTQNFHDTPEELTRRIKAELLTSTEPVDDVTLIILRLAKLPAFRSVPAHHVDAA